MDVNVLVYAVDANAPHHRASRAWLDGALSRNEPVAFAQAVILGFLRLSTHPSVFRRPLSADVAFDIVEAWLAQPPAIGIDVTQRHLGRVRGLLSEVGTAGNLVNDAHLAALALEHGARIVSFDRDFGRFSGLRWSLPGA